MQTDAHILLLEDDFELLETLTDLLEEEGYRVTPVASGMEAVKIAAKRRFDLMIADIRMSGMSGLEAVEHTQKCQSEIATLFVSGYATPENVARAEALQAGAILTKPFEGQVLLDRVAALLQKREQNKAQIIRREKQSRSLSWSLESLAWAIDLPPQDIPARRFRDLAVQMALQLGYPGNVAKEIGLAAALASIESLIQIPEDFLTDRSSLSTLRYCLSTFQDLDSTQESQVVCFVLATLRSDAETLSELDRLNPGLQEAHDAIVSRATEMPLNLNDSGTREPSALISLGLAFERLGDGKAALQAYRQAQSERAPWDAAQGFLEEARLSLAQGQRKDVVNLCKKAAGLASKLGPQNRAIVLFRCGVLTFQAGMDSTLLLRKALELLKPLRFEGTSSLAHLALAAQNNDETSVEAFQGHLSVLSSPRYAGEVSGSSGWLIPSLLVLVERFGHQEFTGQVLRFLRLLPDKTVGLIAGAGVSRMPKMMFLQALEREPKLSAPTGLLQLLAKDSDSEVAGKAGSLLQEFGPGADILTIRCSFLGPFEIYRGAEPIEEKKWKTKKVKYLFAYLAFHWGKKLSADSVCELFWPDNEPERSRKNFYWYNSMIRKCLSGDEPSLKDLLERKDDIVNLNPQVSYWRDIDEFEECFQQGRAAHEGGAYDEAHRLFSQALTLYRGPFMHGYNGDWAQTQREHFARTFDRALAMFSSCALKLNRLAEAEESSLKLLNQDPANEKASEVLMQCFLKNGQPARAIAEYDRCREALNREFGLEPGDALEKVYQLALSGQ